MRYSSTQDKNTVQTSTEMKSELEEGWRKTKSKIKILNERKSK